MNALTPRPEHLYSPASIHGYRSGYPVNKHPSDKAGSPQYVHRSLSMMQLPHRPSKAGEGKVTTPIHRRSTSAPVKIRPDGIKHKRKSSYEDNVPGILQYLVVASYEADEEDEDDSIDDAARNSRGFLNTSIGWTRKARRVRERERRAKVAADKERPSTA